LLNSRPNPTACGTKNQAPTIYARLLGYGKEKLKELRERGIIQPLGWSTIIPCHSLKGVVLFH